MKRATHTLYLSLAICAVIYLSGAFYCVSFNIAKWKEGTREFCSIGFFLSVIISRFILSVQELHDPRDNYEKP